MSVEDTVLGMWKALSARDWDGMKPFLSDDCIYYDVPVGPAAAARGPDDIVKRIRIAFDQLADYQNFPGLLLVNGSDAMYEHHEEWHWPTGEYAVNRFVTVHRAVMCRFAPWTRMCGGCAPSSARTHGC